VKVVVTGATGLIGGALVDALRERGDDVAILSRNPAATTQLLGGPVDPYTWSDPQHEFAPADAFAGADAVVHLAGEPVDQRWSDGAKRRIRDSRELGTRNLVAGIAAADPPPRTLVSEDAPPGHDFLADVVTRWEREAKAAEDFGVRVVTMRTGVVLSPDGGALTRMLTPFKLGVGGPLAGGQQYMPWIDLDDVVGGYLFALDTQRASGPINLSAPEPVTNMHFSQALGRALGRPAVAPVPAFAVRALYGEMATIVLNGVRMVPKRLEDLGYAFRRPDLDAALAAATA
jgi:hypothetical protein